MNPSMEAASPHPEKIEEGPNKRAIRRSRVEAVSQEANLAGALLSTRAGSSARLLTADMVLFILALCIYLGVRLASLSEFPIYFFTDEAVQTVSAETLITNDLRDPVEGTLLPTYFKNGSYYNLSASVYLQVIPYLLWGKSVYLTRTVPVLVSLLAALSVSVILKEIFHLQYWWSGVLLLSAAPAWFLHSRTAFETAIFVSFYAAALCFYLLYRCRSPKFLYPTVGLAALAFYAYSPGQAIVAVTAVALLVSDLGYHWRHRKVVLQSAALVGLLALPYMRFRLDHSAAWLDHLRGLDSYWVQPLPLSEKLIRFGQAYLYGLDPRYWFIPNHHDLERHLMKGYGHLLVTTLPLAALGAGWSLWNYRSPAHRAVMLAALAAPSGGALVGIGITRVLAAVVPASLFMAMGLAKGLQWAGELIAGLRARWTASSLSADARFHLPAALAPVGIFALLGAANLGMLNDALTNGPTWFQDYGLGGMQYGASQLFPAVQDYLVQHPAAQMVVSPTWANGTDVIARFFLGDPLPVQLGSIEGHITQKRPLDENTIFVMTPEELAKTYASHKFRDIRIERTIPYPNGKPGFYFVHLRYVKDIDEILRLEKQARRQLQEEILTLEGQEVRVRYSPLDMGEIGSIFDGDPHTVARTLEANPMVLEISFPQARQLGGYAIVIGSMQARITARLTPPGGGRPVEYTHEVRGSVDQPRVTVDFQQPTEASILRLEILDPHQPEPGNIHVWELELR